MRRRAVPILAGALVALGGCGGDDSGSTKNKSAQLAGKPAEQILTDTAGALRAVRSYHVEGQMTDKKDGPQTLSGDVSDSRSRLRFAQGSQQFEMRIIGPTTYLRANAAFWRDQASDARVVRVLSDHWIKTRDRDQRKIVDGLLPSTLATCLTKHHGAITKKGTGTVGGKPTVVLHDDGNTPGGAPGDLHVAATGRPLPLRATQTGPEKPARNPDPKCDESDSTTTESDISLSGFDEPVQVAVPSPVIDLDALGGQGSSVS